MLENKERSVILKKDGAGRGNIKSQPSPHQMSLSQPDVGGLDLLLLHRFTLFPNQ